MERGLNIPLFDMVMCVANAVDLISPSVDEHHRRTAYIAMNIALEMGLGGEQRANIVLAGALHDVGALSLRDRLDALAFDARSPEAHSVMGYRLLGGFGPFAQIASIVRFHHQKWGRGAGRSSRGTPVPAESHILHVADRVDALIDRNANVLEQAPSIARKIAAGSGTRFEPDAVDAFSRVAGRESFWLDAADRQGITDCIREGAGGSAVRLDTDGVLGLAELFSRMIDFRSRYTAVHSSGVAASAEHLARLAGMPKRRLVLMRLAGYLHDIGKLAVPAEILEKPAKLTLSEFSVIKAHTFYTHRVLKDIDALGDVNEWASYHHERLDGRGYPFHRSGDELGMGSRIMSVADVFTALTESRPYRDGMDRQRVMRVLGRMARDGALDGSLVDTVDSNFEAMEQTRLAAQSRAAGMYREFISSVK